MRSKPLGYAAVTGLALALAAGPAFAQAKGKNKSEDGDKVLDKQMAWEKQVMGVDGSKQSDMKKIAAAQKMHDDARKNPEPLPAPKVKDPNKEGVRAKQEASIGLAIDSDKPQQSSKKAAASTAKKAPEPSNSANDELGALVASSLAEDKATGSKPSASLFGDSPAPATAGGKAKRSVAVKARVKKAKKSKARMKRRGARAEAPAQQSSLDRMFAAAN
jgi:hypothetical protein